MEELCKTLRLEAGRCWTDIVALHKASRKKKKHWLDESKLKKKTKGGKYNLHSQSIQALCEKLIANVDTASSLRESQKKEHQRITAEYPYRPKAYQTVTWKQSAIRYNSKHLILSNGKGQPSLVLPIPEQLREKAIVSIELTWRADHYELCVNTEDKPLPKVRKHFRKFAGGDPGEINLLAVVTDKGEALVISGRGLRAIKRLRNKRAAAYSSRLSRCTPGSRRHRKLLKQKARASAKYYRQQRDFLHKGAHQVSEFCQQEEVQMLAMGDVRDIADGVNKGKHCNQKISQWPHGQFRKYTEEKLARQKCSTTLTPEPKTSRTCCLCGHELSQAPRGRVFLCPGCGARINRDANGGANICSRAKFGRLAKVPVHHVTYRRPLCGVEARIQPMLLPAQAGRSLRLPAFADR